MRAPRVYVNPEDIKNLADDVDDNFQVMVRTYIPATRPLIVYGGRTSLNEEEKHNEK